MISWFDIYVCLRNLYFHSFSIALTLNFVSTLLLVVIYLFPSSVIIVYFGMTRGEM